MKYYVAHSRIASFDDVIFDDFDDAFKHANAVYNHYDNEEKRGLDETIELYVATCKIGEDGLVDTDSIEKIVELCGYKSVDYTVNGEKRSATVFGKSLREWKESIESKENAEIEITNVQFIE